MSAISFSVKKSNDKFYIELKKRVNLYLTENHFGKYANSMVVFKGLLFLFLFWGDYFLILKGFFPGHWLIFGYSLLAIFGLFVAFNISHDATHNTLTSSKLLNKVIFYLTFDPLGMSAYLWGFRHKFSHHIFPNVDDCDVDIDSNFLIRLSPNRPLLSHHRYQWLYAPILYLVYTLHWVFVKDIQYLFKKNLANLKNIKHHPLTILGVILSKILYLFYLIYIPIFWFHLDSLIVLLGFLAFHFTLSYVFLFTNIMNHHSMEAEFPQRDSQGLLPGSWATHQMATCLDFYPTSKFWNFFFGGFNAHCAHHLFPSICHTHYVEISKIISQTANEFNIEYKVTTWKKGIISHFRHLRDLGRISPNAI
jgi:linoleoyl-CoA desaturase